MADRSITLEPKIRGSVGGAIARHKMIEDKDRILIGFSGGKDSFAMLDMLLTLQKRAPVSFEILPVIVDAGFGMDYSKAERHMKKLKLRYLVVRENISSIVKGKVDTKDTGKCCSLCSRLRRGVLYRVAMEEKCNKIALGHNLNDAIETLLMNMFYVSSIDVMRPKYMSEDKKITVIRPLIYVAEELTEEYAKEQKFPIVKQKCLFKRADSRRAMIKELVNKMAKGNTNFYSSMINALEKVAAKNNKNKRSA
jgi:tRNA 2-thiocytidine biosynthesis protein TtcA